MPEFKTIGSSPFCSDHSCGQGCCNKCSRQQSKPHLLYVHVEKTGGSSIECATEATLVQQGYWTNMGHTWVSALESCRKACSFVQPALVVISVRNPYHYYESVFKYAWRGQYSALSLPGNIKNFTEFLPWAVQMSGGSFTQSYRIHHACGTPCKFDHVIHTETLLADWVALLLKFQLPMVGLPKINEANAGESPRGAPPKSSYTLRNLQLVNSHDSAMFSEFGYKMQTSL